MSIIKQKDLFRLFCCGKKKLHVLPRVVVIGLLLLASALAFADDVPINSTTFPDPVFRAYVQKLANSTETLPQSVIDERTTFGNDLNGLGITSLKGIEYFTSLTSLNCEKNPSLTTINLIGNTKLTSLNLTGCKVTSLDVSMCKGLTGLYLSDNKLTELDVSQNTSLTTLSCVNNQLSTLNLSNNKKLQTLYVGRNRLVSLDLSQNTALTKLTCDGNRLTSLAISSTAAPKITTLNISGNALSSVDLSTFTSLSATNSGVTKQTRTMILYTDGTDAYLKVGGGH